MRRSMSKPMYRKYPYVSSCVFRHTSNKIKEEMPGEEFEIIQDIF